MSVAHYSLAFNDESIDKATSIIREINKTAITALEFLERDVIRGFMERKRFTWTNVRMCRAISAVKRNPGIDDSVDRRVVNTMADVVIMLSTAPEVSSQTFGVQVSDMPLEEE